MLHAWYVWVFITVALVVGLVAFKEHASLGNAIQRHTDRQQEFHHGKAFNTSMRRNLTCLMHAD